MVRARWGIENSLHWILDVAFRKDKNRVRTGHVPRQPVPAEAHSAQSAPAGHHRPSRGEAIRHRKAGRNLAYRVQVLSLA